jgi:hypothetical protein
LFRVKPSKSVLKCGKKSVLHLARWRLVRPNETLSITAWEKSHPTEVAACDKEAGWK